MEKYEYILEDGKTSMKYTAHKGDIVVGEVTFVKNDKIYIIDHTYVPVEFRNKGIAKELIDKVVTYAIEMDKKIVPLCPYAKAIFDRNAEYSKHKAY